MRNGVEFTFAGRSNISASDIGEYFAILHYSYTELIGTALETNDNDHVHGSGEQELA